MFKKFFILLFLCSIFTTGYSQNISEQTRRREAAEKEIAYINRQLEANKVQRQRGLNDINFIRKKISNRQNIIKDIEAEINTADAGIKKIEQTVDSLTANLEQLKKNYAHLIYYSYKNRDRTMAVLYILASKNLEQGYRRWNYMKSYSAELKNSAVKIRESNSKLLAEKELLAQAKAKSLAMQNQKQKEIGQLTVDEKESQQLVKQLSQREAQFKKQLEAKRKEVEKLNKEIERILAAATKEKKSTTYTNAAVDRALTGSFESNKGKLPWPVREGVVVEHFGQHNHPVFKNVKLPFNNGVNISTNSHAEVLCIFDGVVKQILVMPGYNQCVLIQHGDYYTFYTKLEKITVKSGTNVKRGDIIGTLTETDGSSIIHFQLWKGTEKQNPELWISK